MKLFKLINLLSLVCITSIYAQIDYTQFKGVEVKTYLEVNLEESYFKQYGSEFMKKYKE